MDVNNLVLNSLYFSFCTRNKKGAYMFGRVDLCDFLLEHPTISRFHAGKSWLDIFFILQFSICVLSIIISRKKKVDIQLDIMRQ